MSVLSDYDLKFNSDIIDPFNPRQIQPASYDLTLYETGLFLPKHSEVDPYETDNLDSVFGWVQLSEYGNWIEAQTLYLFSTVEKVRIPPHLVGRVEGKSSLGRLGLFVHVTAGFIDPGFEGQITLEIFSTNRFKLYPGMPICQLSLQTLHSPSERPYGAGASGSRYQGQSGPQLSRYGHDRERPRKVDSANCDCGESYAGGNCRSYCARKR